MPAEMPKNTDSCGGGRDGADRESAALSPSLTGTRPAGGAFEVKFLLDEPRAKLVRSWAQERLSVDPHADRATGDYAITTTYLDTVDLDIARRSPGATARKFRIRRYGVEECVWLERKIRRKDRVKKQRWTVRDEQLHRLAGQRSEDSWVGDSFHLQVHDRELVPSCCIGYRRSAWFGSTGEGPVRLTLDRSIRGTLHSGWSVPQLEVATEVLVGSVVCELKFHAAMPVLFKELVATVGLTPSGVSKYRRLMECLWT